MESPQPSDVSRAKEVWDEQFGGARRAAQLMAPIIGAVTRWGNMIREGTWKHVKDQEVRSLCEQMDAAAVAFPPAPMAAATTPTTPSAHSREPAPPLESVATSPSSAGGDAVDGIADDADTDAGSRDVRLVAPVDAGRSSASDDNGFEARFSLQATDTLVPPPEVEASAGGDDGEAIAVTTAASVIDDAAPASLPGDVASDAVEYTQEVTSVALTTTATVVDPSFVSSNALVLTGTPLTALLLVWQ